MMTWIALLLSTGCDLFETGINQLQPQVTASAVPSTNGISNTTNPANQVRAEGITSSSGKLTIAPAMEETIGTLGAPSCYGLETDYTYEGNYVVTYASGQTQQPVTELKDLTFIQPTEETLSLSRLDFPDAEVFLLAPQYKDCHGISIYAFAVDKASDTAFVLSFIEDGVQRSTSYYHPLTEPAVVDGMLVLESSEGPGGETQEGPLPRHYKLNLQDRQLEHVSAESQLAGHDPMKARELAWKSLTDDSKETIVGKWQDAAVTLVDWDHVNSYSKQSDGEHELVAEVIFKTTEDEMLGPIRIYVDMETNQLIGRGLRK